MLLDKGWGLGVWVGVCKVVRAGGVGRCVLSGI